MSSEKADLEQKDAKETKEMMVMVMVVVVVVVVRSRALIYSGFQF